MTFTPTNGSAAEDYNYEFMGDDYEGIYDFIEALGDEISAYTLDCISLPYPTIA
jgi:hypothetical protein